MKRILKIFILVTLFLIGLVYLLLQSTPVQNYIIQKITESLETKLGSKVRIGHVDIDFFHGVKFDEVIFCDLHDDTVLYSKEIKLDVGEINWSKKKISINYILLRQANIELQRHQGDNRWAYLILLDNFKSKSKDPSSKQADWAIEIAKIELDDCTFQHENGRASHNENQFDADHLKFRHLSGNLTNLKMEGDSTQFQVSNLRTEEQCGFKVNKLNSLITLTSHELNLSQLQIITPYSVIKDQIVMRFDSIEDFDEIISNVKIEAHLDNSIISFDDLSLFSSDLRGMHQKISLSVTTRGTIDNLKCKNIIAHFGKDSYFKGNATLKGLPDIYETFFDISTKDALLNKDDLEYLLGENLPEEISKLGTINYTVKVIGFMRDFVLDGNFNTAAGIAKTDLNLKFPKGKTESYSGLATFNNFNLGKLTGNNLMEGVSGSITVNGSGLTIKTINTKIIANLNSIRFNNYTYQNITAHGNIANKQFVGKAIIEDENLKLDFNGTIDYSKPEAVFDFDAIVKNANLHTLHLDSTNSILNFQVQMKLKGDKITNIYGDALIPYISYQRDYKKYEFKNLALTSKTFAGRRAISITSDVVDASIDGNYNFNNLVNALENECFNLYPEYFKNYPKTPTQDFVFKINLKKPEEFIELLNPNLKLKPTVVDGYFNSLTHTYALNLKSKQITFNAMLLDSVIIHSQKKLDEPFYLHASTRRIHQESTLSPWVTSDTLILVCDQNSISAFINAIDKTTGNKINIESAFNFMSDGIALQLKNSEGTFSRVNFNFNQKEPIFINKTGVLFHDFTIQSEQQEVVVNGLLSEHNDEPLNLAIHKFQLNTLNSMVKDMGVKLYGEVNGNIRVSNPLNNPYFSSDSNGITVKTFQVDNDTFGNLKINSGYNKSDNIIYSTVRFTDGDLQNLMLEGKIYSNKKTNYLDFDIVMGETPTKVLNFVFKGIASQLEGKLSAKAKLTGTFDQPEINGTGYLKGGGFTVDYLKTHYRIENEILITKNSFELKNAKLYDETNRMAIADVKVNHVNFDKWYLDINIKNLSNFKILNTTTRDNDLFYGTGYATGNVSIIGPVENIKMVMNLKSNRGTLINIPLSNPEYSSKSSYITFKEKSQKSNKAYKVSLSGLELEMNLDINEDAYIKLIFDSQLGDIIEGTGDGNIRMNVTPTGDFAMYGFYEIIHGKYLFTKFDVFNKPFVVKSGGRITWDGDPYAAKVNLEAVYNISQANAASLLQAKTTTSSADPVAYIPVNCILFLKGLLFKPDITFNLEIPKLQNFNDPQLENTVKTYITSWQQNPDELNRQVFSLLFFKRFFPLDNAANATGNSSAAQAGAGGYTALGDLLTAQLTNWLGQVFKNNPFGIDYNKADPTRTGIWVFKLSKKFFNDRLVLEGNYILDGEATNNVTGNVSVQVLLDKSGQLRFTVFSKKLNNKFTDNQNILTSGVGFFWRKEFNTFRRRKKAPSFINTSAVTP